MDIFTKKYIKYKNKYQQLKSSLHVLSGGDYEGKSVTMLTVHRDALIITSMKFANYTKFDTKETENYVEKSTNQYGNNKYLYYSSQTKEDKNLIKVKITDPKENPIIIAIIKDNTVVEKEFFIYHASGSLFMQIKLTDFSKGDDRLTTGTGTVLIYPDAMKTMIELSGKIVITTPPKPTTTNVDVAEVRERNFTVQILSVKLLNETVQFQQDLTSFSNLKQLRDLVARKPQFDENIFFTGCFNLFSNNIHKSYENKVPLFKNIITTVCNSLYYSLDRQSVQILLNYSQILKLLVQQNINIITDKLGNRYDTDNTLRLSHLNNVIKKLPSVISNQNILFKNGKGQFVNIKNNNTNIIFDTGNSATNIIGDNVVKELDLPRIQGCPVTISGIGQDKFCGEYVILDFKFAPDYPQNNDKIYTFTFFVNKTHVIDQMVFAHIDGLDKLFNDNFVIFDQYEETDKRKKQAREENEGVIKKFERFSNAVQKLKKWLTTDKSADIYDDVEELATSATVADFHLIKTLQPDKATKIFAEYRDLSQYFRNTDYKQTFSLMDELVQ